jgi:uncharacterized protein
MREGHERTIIGCKRIVGGFGQGQVLYSQEPLNFLAMVDPHTGMISDSKNPLFGKTLAGRILAYPFAVGSSVGAYVFYSLKIFGKAPAAIVCSKADITTASGCAIAQIPLVDAPAGFNLGELVASGMLIVDADNQKIVAKV